MTVFTVWLCLACLYGTLGIPLALLLVIGCTVTVWRASVALSRAGKLLDAILANVLD